ncbi:MAG: bifunctional folylpolyglutamate synthase/dihydrofolate synthase [Erysipelotrichaceae bacterium]|nr:bifunctional folylpolyglutamate synthase/dihydrofolate synthase [Erysipelotrichaceae bacterium]
MFTKIDEAIDWITSRKSTNYSFEHFKNVCHLAGDPQDGFYMIHVAGTDGKGSTVNYLCDLLMSQGYKVGTLTSPHYETHLDRIRVNGKNITDSAFLNILNANYEFYTENELSMFEMDYLIMCDYFKEENIDYAIVEVGLGGRLDSTNVVDDTKLSIITSIGFDHMDRLGDTLTKICYEKCGIIKKGSKVLCGKLDEECMNVVKEVAEERDCEVYTIQEYTDLGERRFIYRGREYELSSFASYQLHNASLSLEALRIIAEDEGFVIDQEKAKTALHNSLWKGRFEIVRQRPRVILDGAHNIHATEALVESFDRFRGSKCIIFSALKRKEYRKMIQVLEKHCDKLVLTSFSTYNQTIDLNEFEGYVTEPDYQKAIDDAMKEYDNILICGSLYFLSEVVLHGKFD